MPSSLSHQLTLCGIALILAGIVTVGVIFAVVGLLFEFYLFYKGGVT